MADALDIKQGTDRTVTVRGLRDANGQVLDPSGWAIHAVARPGLWAGQVVVWRDTPDTDAGELPARVVDADPDLDPKVVPGEKWIDLVIPDEVSLTWSWSTAVTDVVITEPGTGRKETFSATLRLIPAVVRSD